MNSFCVHMTPTCDINDNFQYQITGQPFCKICLVFFQLHPKKTMNVCNFNFLFLILARARSQMLPMILFLKSRHMLFKHAFSTSLPRLQGSSLEMHRNTLRTFNYDKCQPDFNTSSVPKKSRLRVLGL